MLPVTPNRGTGCPKSRGKRCGLLGQSLARGPRQLVLPHRRGHPRSLGAAQPALAPVGSGRQLLAQLRGRQAAGPSERRVGEAARPCPLPRHAVRARRSPPSAQVPARRARAAQPDRPGSLAPYLRRCTSSRRGWLPGRPLGWTSWCLCRLWCTRMNEEAAAAAAPRGDETPRAQPRRRRPRGGDRPGPGGGGGRGGDGSRGGGRQQSPRTPPAAGR